MTLSLRSRRAAIVAGVMTTALLLPIAGASPALAAGEPAITQIETTDGTVDGTGDYVTYAPGTAVDIRINGSDTGVFSFTGCVAMQTYSDTWSNTSFTTTNPTTFTWTAGTSVESLIPNFIDMDADSGTEYYLELFIDENGTAGTCDDIWYGAGDNSYEYVADFQIVLYDPETMTLSGTAKLGNKVTVAAKVADSLVGNDFDLWACPDTTLYPDDDAQNGNGECYGPLIQTREGNSTEFLLGYDPDRDGASPEEKAAAEEEWNNFCGKYFIVHDYPGGGHSNWVGPIECTTEPQLALTGTNSSAGLVSIAALAAMLLGGALVLVRRSTRSSTR